MNTLLKGKFFQFGINSDGSWNLSSAGATFPSLTGAFFSCSYTLRRRKTRWQPVAVAQVNRTWKEKNLPEPCDQAEFEFEPSPLGVAVAVQVALAKSRPVFYWRLILRNGSEIPIKINSLQPMHADMGRLILNPEQRNIHCFVNGWQSWGFAGALRQKDRQPGPMLGPINTPMHDNGGAAMPWGHGNFQSDMFTMLTDKEHHSAAVIGFLSQIQQFGAISVKLDSSGSVKAVMTCSADDVEVDPEGEIATDWAYLGMAADDVPLLDWYLQAAADVNKARVPKKGFTGWCSWYKYYDRIEEGDLLANIDAAKRLKPELPLDVIQLDDGYQTDVGDWEMRNIRFPNPLSEISGGIRKNGFLPGIWMAPFVVKPTSELFRLHRDWILRGKQGGMANAGYIWFKWSRALDISKPEVLEQIRGWVRTAVKEWGFRYLKLDFLYAPAVSGRLSNPNITRAQALRRALEVIRKEAGGNVFLVGCGCPLGSGIGIFDAMRIGPDVDKRWDPHVLGKRWLARNDPTVPAAANAIRNMLARAPLHRKWWWNDPDCLLIREEDTFLTAEERITLATAIGMTGGMLMISDDLAELSSESRRIAQAMIPPMDGRVEVLDLATANPPEISRLTITGALGEWDLLAVFNWDTSVSEWLVNLEECGLSKDSYVYSFWDSHLLQVIDGKVSLNLPGHGCALLGIRAKTTGKAQYLGSTLHASQGMEVLAWKERAGGLTINFGLGRSAEGRVYLSLPRRPATIRWNRSVVKAERLHGHLYAIPVSMGKPGGTMQITW